MSILKIRHAVVMEGGRAKVMTFDYTILYIIVLYYYIYMVYTGPGSASCKILGGRLPPQSGLYQNWERRGIFSQKMIVRTCGETHSVIDSILAYGSVCLVSKNDILVYE